MPRLPRISDETPFQVMPPLTAAEYEALKASIAENGVMVAVEITPEGWVIDGHHRVRACAELGLTTYPRVVRAGLTRDDLLARALVLNLTRRHLTRQQRSDTISRLRDLGWSNRRIAEATGASEATVRRDVAGASNDAPGKVTGKDGKSYPARRKATSITVSNTHQHGRALKALEALENTEGGLPEGDLPLHFAEKLVRRSRARQPSQPVKPTAKRGIKIYNCPIEDLPVKPGSVDLVLTDPPYTKNDLGVWRVLSEKAAEWLRPGGTLLAYTGHYYLDRILSALAEHLDYRWTITALRSGQNISVRGRHVSSGWVPVVVFTTRGCADTGPHLIDVLAPSPDEGKDWHRWQKPVAELEALLSRVARPGDLVVDPFLGGGSTAVAARNYGMRFIGGDIDAGAVAAANRRLFG